MSSLADALQNTIQNLEKLRDSNSPQSDAVFEALDILYDQQIELIETAINKDTEKYKKATTAIQEAAAKTKQAIDDLTELENAMQKVSDAISKITGFLAKAT